MKTEHLAGAMVGVCGKVMSSTFDVIDSERIFPHGSNATESYRAHLLRRLCRAHIEGVTILAGHRPLVSNFE